MTLEQLHKDETPLQDLSNITDHRTFGEIEDQEQDMKDIVHGSLKERRFDSREEAEHYIGQCIMWRFKEIGVDTGFGLNGKKFADFIIGHEPAAKELYRLYRVRLSYHRESQEDEYWQAGYYIYWRDELVAFISKPKQVQSEIILSVPFYLVRTNINLPGGKGRII